MDASHHDQSILPNTYIKIQLFRGLNKAPIATQDSYNMVDLLVARFLKR